MSKKKTKYLSIVNILENIHLFSYIVIKSKKKKSLRTWRLDKAI